MINRMFTFYIFCPIIFLSAYSVVGNTEDLFEGHVPQMKIEEVIRTAKEYVMEKEIKIDGFFVQNARYDSSEQIWLLLFNGNIPRPGNHFMISIDDASGELRLIPGR